MRWTSLKALGWLGVRLSRGRRHRAALHLVAAVAATVGAVVMAVLAVPGVIAAQDATRDSSRLTLRATEGLLGPPDSFETTGLYATTRTIEWRDRVEVEAFYVAGVRADAPVPPGIPRLPEPGEAYVSPGLAGLLAEDRLLARRIPAVTGEITPDGVSGPDDLRAYIGADSERLQALHRIHRPVHDFGGPEAHSESGQRSEYGPILWLLALLTVGLFVVIPLLGLMVVAFAQVATRRADRLGMLVEIGVPARRARLAVCADSLVAAGLGAAVGVTLTVLASRFVTGLPGVPASWWPADVSWPWWSAPTAVGGPVLVGAVAVAFTRPRRAKAAQSVRRRHWWIGLLPLGFGLALVAATAGMRVDDSLLSTVLAVAGLGLVCLTLPIAARTVVTRVARRGLVAETVGRRLAAARILRGPVAARRAFVVMSVAAVLATAVAPLVAQVAPSSPPPPLNDQRIVVRIEVPPGTEVAAWRELPGVVEITAQVKGQGYPMPCASVTLALGRPLGCAPGPVRPGSRARDADGIAVGSPVDRAATGKVLAIVTDEAAYWRLSAEIGREDALSSYASADLGETYADDLVGLQKWLRLGMVFLLAASAIGTALGLAEDTRARRHHAAGLIALGTPPAVLRGAHRHELALRTGSTTFVTLFACACLGWVAARWSGTNPLPPGWWGLIIGVLVGASILVVAVMPRLVPTTGELDELRRD